MRQELHHILNDFGAGQVVIDKLLYQQLEGPFIACSSLLDQDGIRRILRDAFRLDWLRLRSHSSHDLESYFLWLALCSLYCPAIHFMTDQLLDITDRFSGIFANLTAVKTSVQPHWNSPAFMEARNMRANPSIMQYQLG